MDANYLFSVLGYVIIIFYLIKFFSLLWIMFRSYFLTSLGFVKDLRKYGEWVVVTGGTDGIGKQYARQLAERGFKVVLISRTHEKLVTVAKEIEDEFNVETKIICFDFTQIDGYEKIEEVVSKLDVGILVNNVGMTLNTLHYFHDSDMKITEDALHCNMFSDVQMTHMVLKGMASRQRGCIIHISSISIFVSVPYLNIYPSTKIFMEKLFKSLKTEYSGVIDHQLVTPGYVSTALSNKKPGLSIPTPEDYVRSAVRTIGIMDTTCGYFSHEILRFVLLNVPNWLPWLFLKKNVYSRLKKD